VPATRNAPIVGRQRQPDQLPIVSDGSAGSVNSDFEHAHALGAQQREAYAALPEVEHPAQQARDEHAVP
jgi:hypothetical protein